ncbi:MAG: putative membrane-bound dehydrogenase-like protein [Rubritalea sp.]|jgi:putative membrane-bound dehydrogenase-like protein
MKSQFLLPAIILCSAFVHGEQEVTSAESKLIPIESFKLHDKQYKIERWAHSPMLYNPTSMDVDVEGNVWVTESLNYRKYRGNNKSNKSFPKGDRVSILSDSNGDGKADESHVFVQDEDLVAPLGVAVLDNKIYVSCSPSLIVYTDVNRNLRFDKGDTKEIFLTGFGGKDHDHSLHKMEAGPDGRFYLNTGNAGPHKVKDKSGWELRASSWYGKNSLPKDQKRTVLKSDDGRVYTGGVMLSIKEDGTDLKVIGHNFRNPYGHSVDSFGSIWMNDNDDTQSCRTTWIMRYGNLGYNSEDGSETWQAGKRPGQTTPTAHWRQDDPGVIPSGHVYGNASPTGMVYNEVAEGMLLSCEAGQNVIWGYNRKRQGAGFEMKGFPFLSSTGIQDPNYKWKDLPKDVNKWFRPSDIVVGTDGSIYISDWFDPTVGGHLQNERGGIGSIYRISPVDKKLKTPNYDFTTLEGSIIALDSPAVNVRYKARKNILQSDDKSKTLDGLKKDFENSNRFTQARRLWLIAELGDAGYLEEVMKSSPSTDVKLAAYRALELHTKDIIDLASKAMVIDDIALRREILLSLRDVPFEKCSSILLNLISYFDGIDRWYLEAIGTAADGKEEQLYTSIKKPVSDWDDKLEKIMWRLHPASAVGQFKERAISKKASEVQRTSAIDALAFIKTKPAALALLEIHGHCEGTLKEYCLWWLNNRSRNHWQAYLADVDLKLLNQVKVAFDKLKEEFLKNSTPESLAALVSSTKGSKLLLQLAIQGEIPNKIKDPTTQALLNHKNAEIQSLAQTYLTKKKSTYDVAAILKIKGDPARGKSLFDGRAICASCHNVSGKGGEIGPELTAINTKFNQESLLDAIINPSSGILIGYESVSIILNNGKKIDGTLLSNKDPLIVQNALGQKVELPKSEIKTQVISKKSIMPEAAAIGLKQQDLADILSYLNNIKK